MAPITTANPKQPEPAAQPPGLAAAVRKKFQSVSPWTAMTACLALFVTWGILFLPPAAERALIAAAVIPVGVALDYALHKLQTGRSNWQSAFITSAIVTVLMPPDVNPGIAVLAVALAIGSKHFILAKAGVTVKRHIFNPAATGVAVAAALFGFPLGWWPDSFLWLTLALGLVCVWRVRKGTQVIAYGVVYTVLVTLTAGFPAGSLAFSDFGTQTLPLALPFFFMLFMLTEPVTSLQHRVGQLQFGALAALVAFGVSYLPVVGGAAVLWGLLAANLFAELRRKASD